MVAGEVNTRGSGTDGHRRGGQGDFHSGTVSGDGDGGVNYSLGAK